MPTLTELHAVERDLEQRLAAVREQIREEVNYQQAHCEHEYVAALYQHGCCHKCGHNAKSAEDVVASRTRRGASI